MVDLENSAPPRPRQALVLGGGGVTGIAWETGFLAGAAERGLDLVSADLVVGTSAGATVAAQVTSGVGLDHLLAAQLDPYAGIEPVLPVDIRAVLAEIDALLASSEDPLEARRRVGRYALEADVPTETARRAIIAQRLPSHAWPASRLVVTAVDVATGVFVELDRMSGVDMVDAVAASCAIPGVWPPVTDGSRRLIDGGMRTGSNADVAREYDRVLVLEPFGRAATPGDVAELDPAQVIVVEPEPEYRAVAPNALDPAARPLAAEIGREHGRRAAAGIQQFWEADRPSRAERAQYGASTRERGTRR